MNDFEAYYWRIDALDVANARAGELLYRSQDHDELLQAFAQLLNSEDVAARGIALDHLSYAETLGRFSIRSPFLAFVERALEVSRAELKRAPVTSTSPRGSTVIGANHASALGVLHRFGHANDLEVIVRFLIPSQDLNVLEEACMAATHCLRDADSEISRMVGARLVTIFRDPDVELEARTMAISAFLNNPSLDQDPALFDMLVGDTAPLSAYAAWALVDRNLDNPEFRRLVAAWPDDALYPAREVRERLRQYTEPEEDPMEPA